MGTDVCVWPIATNFSLGPDVSFRGEAEVGRAAEPSGSLESDPGCVKTLGGITAPGILGPTVMRSKKTQKFVFRSALRPNQISFSHDQDPNATSASHSTRQLPCAR